MRFVPVKDEEQQANSVVFRARDLLVRQRTQCINAGRNFTFQYLRLDYPEDRSVAAGFSTSAW